MKRRILLVLLLVLAMLFAVSCQTGTGNNQGQQNDSENTEGGFDRSKVTFLTAYSEAQNLGFEGTLEEFIALVSGKDGVNGKDGADGVGISSILINQQGNLIVLLTNGTTVDCGVVVGTNGKDGTNGEDGATPTIEISSDGYWVINGNKTEVKAKGEDGAPGATGATGATGQDGKTPTIEINADGYWVINGIVSDIKAKGEDGAPGATGATGQDGKTPTIEINADGYWVINGVVSDVKAKGEDGAPGATGATGATGQDGKTPTIEISEDGYWVINGVKTEYKAFYDEYEENPQGLDFYLKPDGTYAVSIGKAIYLTEIVIPSTYHGKAVTEILDHAFAGRANLTSVTIGNSVTSIGNSVTSIGESAFEDCPNLTSVTIGDSVTSIGESAFEDCTNLTSVTIGDSVTSIGNSAFYNCYSLTSVTIGNSVTEIGEWAFYNCSSLTSITISDSVISIARGTFSGCYNLIVKENGVDYVDKWVVDCDHIVTVANLRDDTKGIADYAFRYCSSLTSVTIGNSVTAIGDYAFQDCTNLTSVTIGDSVTSIGNSAFYNCYSLTSVTIGNSVTEIGEWAFHNCSSLTSVTIPDSVTSIGNSAFSNCYDLTSVTIGNSVTSIGSSAFSGCSSLMSVTIGNSVTSIGSSAFSSCSSLTSVTIPSSVTKIGNYAFSGCNALTSLIFMENSKLSTLGHKVFELCFGIETVIIDNEIIKVQGVFQGIEINAGKIVVNASGASEYPWEKTALIFQMSDNTNGNELTSGARRFLAGETNDNEDIDKSVDERNALAEKETKVDVTYTYWPDDADHRWGENIDKIYAAVSSGASSSADMYSVFVYDMVGAMLKGCFANTLTDTRGTNYFRFAEDDYDGVTNDEGYMYEYMTSLTLSSKKMYLIASDYFTDLVRAFFVVPVNAKLLEENAAAVTGDVDGDGWSGSYADFIKLVDERKWNYELLKAYCDAVATENQNGEFDLDGIVGFAISSSSDLSSSGLLYTTPITIINRKGNDLADYEYSYPETNEQLTDFCVKLQALMRSDGAYVHSGSLDEIRQAFATNHVLFGGVICVGSLEDEVYQKMRNEGGFGVVPVPLYSNTYIDANGAEQETTYLTQIHNLGCIGGISANTTKFSQCSAFLNYVSTNSTEILDEYYDWKLSIGYCGGFSFAEANWRMLKMIRSNVRSAFDKVFEDAIGIYGNFHSNLYHKVIQNGKMAEDFNVGKPYQVGEDMTRIYAALYKARKEILQAIYDDFNGSTYTD